MINDPSKLKALAERVLTAPLHSKRRLIAIAGAPASGKSTLAQELVTYLVDHEHPAQVVPMDGFHLDNKILEDKGLLARKGAPETFDAEGLIRLITALKTENSVYFPEFDRTRDIAIAGAGHVAASCETIVVEGNYLLLDCAPWSRLAKLWDYTIWVDVPKDELRTRLMQRWLGHGLSEQEALARTIENDLPNAELAIDHSLPVDEIIR